MFRWFCTTVVNIYLTMRYITDSSRCALYSLYVRMWSTHMDYWHLQSLLQFVMQVKGNNLIYFTSTSYTLTPTTTQTYTHHTPLTIKTKSRDNYKPIRMQYSDLGSRQSSRIKPTSTISQGGLHRDKYVTMKICLTFLYICVFIVCHWFIIHSVN